MRQDKVAYMHFRHCSYEDNLQPKGGLTLAYQLSYTLDAVTGVFYNVALCNSKDHYNKRIGKLISGGRLKKEPRFTGIEDPLAWFDEIEAGIVSEWEADDGCVLVNTSRGKSA